MAQLIEIQIDVNKITKSKLYQGAKGKYLKLTVSVNDEANEHGQDVSAYEQQTKEERERGDKKNFLGNGKTFWASNGHKTVDQKSGKEVKPSGPTAPNIGDDDDLPF